MADREASGDGAGVISNDHELQSMVLDNALRARSRWNWNDEINPEHLLAVLMEEVGELSAATMGKHEHDPAYELIQIGGIILNWLHQIPIESVMLAAEQERCKHP